MSLHTKPARPKRCNSPRPLSAFATLCMNKLALSPAAANGSDEPLRHPVGQSHRSPCQLPLPLPCMHPSSPRRHRTDDATRQAIRSNRRAAIPPRSTTPSSCGSGHRRAFASDTHSPSHLLIKINASPPPLVDLLISRAVAAHARLDRARSSGRVVPI